MHPRAYHYQSEQGFLIKPLFFVLSVLIMFYNDTRSLRVIWGVILEESIGFLNETSVSTSPLNKVRTTSNSRPWVLSFVSNDFYFSVVSVGLPDFLYQAEVEKIQEIEPRKPCLDVLSEAKKRWATKLDASRRSIRLSQTWNASKRKCPSSNTREMLKKIPARMNTRKKRLKNTRRSKLWKEFKLCCWRMNI